MDCRTRNIVLLCVCLTFSARVVQGQVDAQFSQYNEFLSYYNPGAVGLNNQLNVHAIHKMQWVGIDNAPTSFFFGADMPLRFLKRQHGVGISFFNESIGLFTNQAFSIQYAYKLKLFGGQLSFGPQIGLFDQNFDATKIHNPSSDYHQGSDEGIPIGNAQGMAFDMSLGAYFTHKYFYAGLSSSHIMESTIELDEKTSTYIPRAFYFVAGSNIRIKKTLIDLQPSVFVKSDLIATQVDVTLRAWYDKKFNGGLSWRYGNAVVVMLGAKIKNVQVGYAYDIDISPISKVSSGSHEIMLSYLLDMDNSGNRKNKHKSVRIL